MPEFVLFTGLAVSQSGKHKISDLHRQKYNNIYFIIGNIQAYIKTSFLYFIDINIIIL